MSDQHGNSSNSVTAEEFSFEKSLRTISFTDKDRLNMFLVGFKQATSFLKLEYLKY